jgi:microcin C transport system substrate-binding protein
MKSVLAFLSIAFAAVVRADTLHPPDTWRDAPDPVASELAVPGGEIVCYNGPQPKSLNYYLDHNTFTVLMFSSFYETMLDMDPITTEYVPGLAKRWSISEDKRTFTFWLDDRARWSDGQPVTAEDVLWTFQAIMNPSNLTGVHKVSLETFTNVTRVAADADARAGATTNRLPASGIRFAAREVHWRNLGAAGGFPILPKHVFETNDFNKINFVFPVVSGPYRPGEFVENRHTTMERRGDWWRRADRRFQRVANFQTVRFRFFEEPDNALEAFKKGELDVFPVHMARQWVNDTKGEKFDRNWIVKQKIFNHNPIGFQGFAMNMRRPPFDDRRVRLAMAHLLDREHLNQTLMYNQYFLHRSYYEDLYSKETPCPNAAVAFDKEKARDLLKQAGWSVNASTGMLEKDGKPLRFRFLTRDQHTDRYVAKFTRDLKDLGVEMTIDRKDHAAWTRDMDEFNYDMTWAAWSAGVFKDPEHEWSSKEADRKSGNNITGFRSGRVDALIEAQKSLFDAAARHAICREIDGVLASEVPYVLLWNLNYARLAYWNKFGVPSTVLSKYGDESSFLWYGWHDPDAADELSAALKSGRPVPPRPAEVVFDDVFKTR